MRTSCHPYLEETLSGFFRERSAVEVAGGGIASLLFYEAEFYYRRFTNRTALLRDTFGSMAERSTHV